jgi:hypothetical protein
MEDKDVEHAVKEKEKEEAEAASAKDHPIKLEPDLTDEEDIEDDEHNRNLQPTNAPSTVPAGSMATRTVSNSTTTSRTTTRRAEGQIPPLSRQQLKEFPELETWRLYSWASKV